MRVALFALLIAFACAMFRAEGRFMETVCQVNFNLMNRREVIRAEQVLREYLLRVSDSVSMNYKNSSPLSFVSLIPHPVKIRRFRNSLQDGDIASETGKGYSFNLTENIKTLLNRSTLFLDGSGIFYNLSDPKFFSKENEIAALNSNEKIMNLYIPDSDKVEIADQGVYLDSPQI